MLAIQLQGVGHGAGGPDLCAARVILIFALFFLKAIKLNGSQDNANEHQHKNQYRRINQIKSHYFLPISAHSLK